MTHSPAFADRPGRTSDQPINVVVGAMAAGLVLMGVVLALVGGRLVMPPAWMLAVVAAATVAAWAMVALGPAPRAGAGGAPPAGVLQSLVLLRAALLESPALVGLALGFVADPVNLTVYVLPAIFALGGLWLFARPGVVRRWALAR
jgi:hypothetical protein